MSIPTTDELRNDIDQGRTGEKVAMPDPATVPLGTDAEAGGTPPTPQERKLEAAAIPAAPKEEPRPASGALVYLVLIAVLGLALIGVVFLAAR